MLFANMTTAQKNECLEKYRYINVEEGTNWDVAHIEAFKETLEEKGFIGVSVRWSGFSSQGDGASFTFDGVDTSVYFKGVFDNPETSEVTKEFLRQIKYICKEINNRYVHSNSVRVDDDVSDLDPELDISYPTGNTFKTMLAEFVVSESNSFYRELENVYYDLISDEEVANTLIANEYNFNVYDMSIRDSVDQGLTIKEQAALLISTAKVMIAHDVSAAAACSNAYDGIRRGHLMAEGIDRERADNILEVELSQMVE